MLPLTIFTPSPSKSGLIVFLVGSPVLRMMQFKYIVSKIENIACSISLTLVEILNFTVEVAPHIVVLQSNY